MVKINLATCVGCGMCVRECPVGALSLIERKAVASDRCVQCNICIRVCKFQAISRAEQATGTIKCSSCPVQCENQDGFTGACRR